MSSAGGAEVIGVDLRTAFTPALSAELKHECLDRGFLLFRDQDIGVEDQHRFASTFGAVHDSRTVPSFVTSTGELLLHFDHWLVARHPQPIDFTVLYALEVTQVGGETALVNTKHALGRLDDSTTRHLVGLNALHCYNYSSTNLSGRVRQADLPAGQPFAIHPVVRRHPVTGERTLYVSPRNTDHILGHDSGASDYLLDELTTHLLDPDHRYLHRWRVGDLLIWDNHAMLHGRRPYDPTVPRKLRRMCVA